VQERPTAPRKIEVTLEPRGDGWLADVRLERTRHRVRISRAELERYGGGDVTDLVRRSFEFLLEREPAESILREFDISVIERYFPEYPQVIRARTPR
jgi:hypothetical protein